MTRCVKVNIITILGQLHSPWSIPNPCLLVAISTATTTVVINPTGKLWSCCTRTRCQPSTNWTSNSKCPTRPSLANTVSTLVDRIKNILQILLPRSTTSTDDRYILYEHMFHFCSFRLKTSLLVKLRRPFVFLTNFTFVLPRTFGFFFWEFVFHS